MNCKNDVFMRMIGIEKLDKRVRMDFDVQRFLPECRKIRASKYVATDETNPTYDALVIPTNQFECMNSNCVNSGTLRVGGENTIYKAANAEDFANGVITFYVTANATGATVTISNAIAMTNADIYTVTAGAAVNGFKPVFVDLTQNPTNVVGTGWTPGDGYAYIEISITGDDVTSDDGLSSIAIFDSVEDFQTSTHVQAACLTSIDGSWDLDVAENACFPNNYSYNENRAFEKTLTFTKVTPNYWRLNPLWKRGEATTGFDVVTVEKTIKSETIGASTYGVVTIDDMNQDECRFVSASLVEPCVVEDAQLEKLSVPMGIALDGDRYVLVDAGNGETKFLFNQALVGKNVLISYPKLVDVEEFLITDEDINDLRTSMSYVKKHTDGHKYRFTFNNVLVTSFGETVGEDENEFTITVSIQKDERGRFGYAHKIID